LQIDQKLTKL